MGWVWFRILDFTWVQKSGKTPAGIKSDIPSKKLSFWVKTNENKTLVKLIRVWLLQTFGLLAQGWWNSGVMEKTLQAVETKECQSMMNH